MDENLQQRITHLSLRDTKTLSQATLKAMEELGELAKVILPHEGAHATNHRFVDTSSILEEIADTALCLASIAVKIGISLDEFWSMLERKSNKWETLLNNEERHLQNGGMPFEIHITVEPTGDPTRFKEVCTSIGIKPITLDLINGSVMPDWMTSSTTHALNSQALNQANNIANTLVAHGFVVKRVKLETVPWHPKALAEDNLSKPPEYLETHIPVKVAVSQLQELKQACADISSILQIEKLHLSRNPFKVLGDGLHVVMVTLRIHSSNISIVEFERIKHDVIDHITRRFQLAKENPHTEYAIYDSNVAHDNRWTS